MEETGPKSRLLTQHIWETFKVRPDPFPDFLSMPNNKATSKVVGNKISPRQKNILTLVGDQGNTAKELLRHAYALQ